MEEAFLLSLPNSSFQIKNIKVDHFNAPSYECLINNKVFISGDTIVLKSSKTHAFLEDIKKHTVKKF